MRKVLVLIVVAALALGAVLLLVREAMQDPGGADRSSPAASHASSTPRPDAPPEHLDPVPGRATPVVVPPPGPAGSRQPLGAAQIGREAGAPGELPDDQLDVGDCVLTLRLDDRETGKPVASAVRIWRVAVSANSKWSAGDQVQRKVDVPSAGAVITKLPAGRYRIEVDGENATADDQPEFELRDKLEMTVRVSAPRTLPVRCSVVDAYGAVVANARRRAGQASWASSRPRAAPPWSSPRRETGAAPTSPGWEFSAPSPADRAPPRDLVVGPQGFDLGSIEEGTRVRSYSRSDSLEFDGRNSLHVAIDGRRIGTGTFVGVAVPLRDLVAHVLTPSDRSAFDLGAVVSAECDAVLRTADAPSDLWRTVGVKVKIALDGFEPLEFTWRAADLPLAIVHLTPTKR